MKRSQTIGRRTSLGSDAFKVDQAAAAAGRSLLGRPKPRPGNIYIPALYQPKPLQRVSTRNSNLSLESTNASRSDLSRNGSSELSMISGIRDSCISSISSASLISRKSLLADYNRTSKDKKNEEFALVSVDEETDASAWGSGAAVCHPNGMPALPSRFNTQDDSEKITQSSIGENRGTPGVQNLRASANSTMSKEKVSAILLSVANSHGCKPQRL